ncbi:hypothetical protein BS47DRAFT_1141928 [Hydnum rufescens UP504]|uniref:RING-type domain-containing protein n=1 Tax=Hydnum rufescens UP504 TaxID=1448309 RepID=A0A9P6ATF7_9AGAM|nr:hypothetical protein BS47DRAFT_1141928 [Hydnum rufescens UP504]
MDAIRGLPLLSGPPPQVEEPNRHGCRKCGKEFGLFTRSRICNHCGFSYCTSCSDHQALMAREANEPGYDVVQVCAYCIERLSITASGRGKLRALPVSQLRNYLKAYGLPTPTNVLEKDDIVDAVMAARAPNGCLSPEHEDYYRKHSVPNKSPERRTRSLFSRMTGADGGSTPPIPPRPAPRTNQQTRSTPSRPTAARSQAPRQPPSQYNAPNSNPYRYRPPPGPIPNVNPTSRPYPPRPSSAPAPPPRPPSPTVPSLDSLLEMRPDELHALSVGSLKAILFENHVIPGQVLEKDDLVAKVQLLLDNEQRERARETQIRAAEEQTYLEQQARMREEFRMREQQREREREPQRGPGQEQEQAWDSDMEQQDDNELGQDFGDDTVMSVASDEGERHTVAEPEPADDHGPIHSHETTTASSSPPKPMSSTTVERSGLCVVCQDDEANIVVVDCGHLAMCRGCSDLVMNSSRECPLCRTRIVTPQRLLRVFKT